MQRPVLNAEADKAAGIWEVLRSIILTCAEAAYIVAWAPMHIVWSLCKAQAVGMQLPLHSCHSSGCEHCQNCHNDCPVEPVVCVRVAHTGADSILLLVSMLSRLHVVFAKAVLLVLHCWAQWYVHGAEQKQRTQKKATVW